MMLQLLFALAVLCSACQSTSVSLVQGLPQNMIAGSSYNVIFDIQQAGTYTFSFFISDDNESLNTSYFSVFSTSGECAEDGAGWRRVCNTIYPAPSITTFAIKLSPQILTEKLNVGVEINADNTTSTPVSPSYFSLSSGGSRGASSFGIVRRQPPTIIVNFKENDEQNEENQQEQEQKKEDTRQVQSQTNKYDSETDIIDGKKEEKQEKITFNLIEKPKEEQSQKDIFLVFIVGGVGVIVVFIIGAYYIFIHNKQA